MLKELAAHDGMWCSSATELGRFVERYIVAEALARRLITIVSGKPCPHTLYLNSLQSAVRSIGLAAPIPPKLVREIFLGGELQSTNNSPRQLRNAIIHGLSVKAITELNMESRKLMSLMQRWLKYFDGL